MTQIVELRKNVQAAANEIRKHADEFNARVAAGKEPWPDNTKQAYDEVNARYDALSDQLKKEEDSAAIAARINQISEDELRSKRHGKAMPGLDDRLPGEQRTYGDAGYTIDEARQVAQRELDKRNALRAWMVAEDAPHLVTEEMRDSAHRLKVPLDSRRLDFQTLDQETVQNLRWKAQTVHPANMRSEIRALSKVTAGLGPELVPQSWLATIELAMIAYGPMLAYVTPLITENGQQINYPTGDDTANAGTVIATEATDIQTLGEPDPVIGSLALRAFEYTSRFIKVPNVLTRDALINIDLLVATFIGERMGRIYTQHATTGNGTNQFFGIVTDSVAGATAASATAIAGDDLINLQQSVDPAYRASGIYMCHDNILGAIRRLKDTTNQYLWTSNLRDGLPDTLNGRPIITNPYMASTMAATNISVVYGDFSKYILRQVGTGMLMRLTERFAERLQTAFLFHQSADGRLIKVAAAGPCPVKRLTH